MKIINKLILLDFSKKHPKLESSLEAWIRKVRNENWLNQEDVLKTFPHAKPQLFHRICFAIVPGSCYLAIAINYSAQAIALKWIGTFYQYPDAQSSLFMCA
ncbi:MAG: type II toxin-antitoxin system HigB family toxin [Alphaproteobacteria bacterium]|nr:type II toxin-antitoxin system HigB family toxin [Alphaproteobacteria bacterium]